MYSTRLCSSRPYAILTYVCAKQRKCKSVQTGLLRATGILHCAALIKRKSFQMAGIESATILPQSKFACSLTGHLKETRPNRPIILLLLSVATAACCSPYALFYFTLLCIYKNLVFLFLPKKVPGYRTTAQSFCETVVLAAITYDYDNGGEEAVFLVASDGSLSFSGYTVTTFPRSYEIGVVQTGRCFDGNTGRTMANRETWGVQDAGKHLV